MTADHGASKIPAYLNSIGVKSKNIEEKELDVALNNILINEFGSDKLISKIVNNQIYINNLAVDSLNLNYNEVEEKIINFLNELDFIDGVFTSEEIINGTYEDGYELLIQNGFNIQRSGDVIFKFHENVIKYGNRGTTHGSGYSYDTHVP